MLKLAVPLMALAFLLDPRIAVLSAADDTASVAPGPAVPLTVKVDQGLVSVDVRDAILADVLRAVSEQSVVRVTIHSGGTDRVTQSFDGVPLDEAVRQLARGHDVVLIYGSQRNRAGAGHLVEIRVYQTAAPAGPVVVDPRQRQARLQVVRTLVQQAQQQQPGALASLAGIVASDPDPVVRQNATAAFARFRGPDAVAALTTALGDKDSSVRTTAVSSLGLMRDEALAGTIAQTLARDPDAAVRRAAVRALVPLRSEDAHRGLEAATSDPDASVRQAATGALGQWERRARAGAN